MIHIEEDDQKTAIIPHGSPKFNVWYSTENNRVDPKDEDDDITDGNLTFIDFDVLAEQWNKYEYSLDGITYYLKLKTNVIKIQRYENAYDKYGYPRYSLDHVMSLSLQQL